MPSVRDIIDQIERELPNEIAFALNSSSYVNDNPFEDSDGFERALRFLATTYRDAMMGTTHCPDLRTSCVHSSGFTYMPHQSMTAKGKYPHEYKAVYQGRTVWLDKHLRKGTSKEARYSMRIAFEYIKEEQKVIIGYIGPHQRNGNT